jgi:hypothetical protein
VPSPEKILGYPIGTPNKLTYTKTNIAITASGKASGVHICRT